MRTDALCATREFPEVFYNGLVAEGVVSGAEGVMKQLVVKKTIGLALVVFVSAAATFACGKTLDAAAPIEDASVDATNDFETGVRDASTPDADAGPAFPECAYPDDIGVQVDESAPVAHQGRCSNAQIDEGYTACFSGVLELPDGGYPCDDFYAANEACALCLNGPNSADAGTFPVPVILPTSQTTIAVDTYGCIAAISSADSSCRLRYEQIYQYAIAVCVRLCTAAEFPSCVAYFTTDFEYGPYGELGDLSPACTAAIAAVSPSEQQEQCGVGIGDFHTQYEIVATTMCGP